MTEKQIRQDLKDIQYYYANKEIFEIATKEIGTNYVYDLSKKYNEVIRKAPPKLYDLYVRLYILNKTQDIIAFETNYSMQTVVTNCKNLMSFLYQELNKKEGANEQRII